MNRIEAIYSNINIDESVIDVGCDQCELGIMLAKRNQASICSDISEKVIEKAKVHTSKYSKYISLIVSDGLASISEKQIDTLVIAGMGTYTILEIIGSSKIIFKKIITISNNNHDILRSKMKDFNYIVDREQIIKEKNKYYNLIVFKEGTYNYSESEVALGINHVDDKMYMEYLNYLLKKYKKIKLHSKDKNKKIVKIINLIESHV